MKTSKKLLSLALAGVMALSLSVAAFAADTQTLDEADAESYIPVTISSSATVFDVTVPTALPIAVDPETGETKGAENVTIVNNSAGSIRVSEISVITKTSNLASAADTGWYLKDYAAFDFRNADVDSNGIGIAVQPLGGREEADDSDTLPLVTDDSNEAAQTLLTYTKGGGTANTLDADYWVLDAKNSGDTDELTISYDAKATSVSGNTNEQVASIVITIAWNKG